MLVPNDRVPATQARSATIYLQISYKRISCLSTEGTYTLDYTVLGILELVISKALQPNINNLKQVE